MFHGYSADVGYKICLLLKEWVHFPLRNNNNDIHVRCSTSLIIQGQILVCFLPRSKTGQFISAKGIDNGSIT